MITRFDQLKEIECAKMSAAKSLEFKHYDQLWSKLLAVPDAGGSPVINSLVNLIIRLHSQLNKPLRAHVLDIRTAFLASTTNTLNTMLNAKPQPNWDHVYRVLLLLERFVAGDLDRDSADRVIEPRALSVVFTVKVCAAV